MDVRVERTVVGGLAAFRLTWLVTRDEFPPVKYLRERVTEDDRAPEWLADLVSCGWCASGWISLGIAALLRPRSKRDALLQWWATWAVAALLWDYWTDRQAREAREVVYAEGYSS